MGRGRRKRRQDSLWIATEELPRTAGHVFWERVDRTLNDTEFQPFVEDAFEKFNAAAMGRPGVAPKPGVCEAFISRDGRTFSNASEYSMRQPNLNLLLGQDFGNGTPRGLQDRCAVVVVRLMLLCSNHESPFSRPCRLPPSIPRQSRRSPIHELPGRKHHFRVARPNESSL